MTIENHVYTLSKYFVLTWNNLFTWLFLVCAKIVYEFWTIPFFPLYFQQQHPLLFPVLCKQNRWISRYWSRSDHIQADTLCNNRHAEWKINKSIVNQHYRLPQSVGGGNRLSAVPSTYLTQLMDQHTLHDYTEKSGSEQCPVSTANDKLRHPEGKL